MSLIVPTIDELVASDHPYRSMLQVLDFGKLTRPLRELCSELGRGGYPIEQGFRCLLLQYVEDLSDRQMERCLRENLAAKLFCGFELLDQTPEFSCFSRLRSRIGLAELTARDYLVSQGCHAGVILKNNMKEKDHDKDRWLSSVRMPYEGVFARLNKRARYRGTIKNQFQALMQAFAHNPKRLIKIEAGPIPLIEV
jgi:hypothetical protein